MHQAEHAHLRAPSDLKAHSKGTSQGISLEGSDNEEVEHSRGLGQSSGEYSNSLRNSLRNQPQQSCDKLKIERRDYFTLTNIENCRINLLDQGFWPSEVSEINKCRDKLAARACLKRVQPVECLRHKVDARPFGGAESPMHLLQQVEA